MMTLGAIAIAFLVSIACRGLHPWLVIVVSWGSLAAIIGVLAVRSRR